MPIVVLFYQSNGLSIKQVFILQSIYSLSIVLLEIPSGYFADVLGRKNSLIAGAILGFAGYSIYSISAGFIGFMIAEIILGFGQSMISGADSALLYDSLLDDGKQDNYLKLEGRMTSIGNFAEATAGIIGGLLAAYSLRYPYYGQTLIAFIAFPAALTLIEPKINQNRIDLNWKQIIGIVRYSLIENAELRWNIIYSSVVGASTLTMAWFVQPWLIRADVKVESFGIIWTGLNLIVGVAAMYAYKTELKFGRKQVIIAFSIAIGLGFIIAGIIPHLWALTFFVIFYIARGIATPILKDGINRISPSNMRATILSVRNFTIRIIFSIWGPFYGWLTDKWSLMHALVIAGMIFIVLASISIIALSRKKI
ncbi:MFS transporter [Tenuifilaceae bacterium CYCD]|nr:MFS transporter [Tenuifilaceae bacterium CYCD]